MRFDRFTVSLLILQPDAPKLDEAAASRLQDAHMVELADAHDAGLLLAAGPLLGPEERTLRGLSIWNADSERARVLAERNPGVVEGRFRIDVLPWLVPAGAMIFHRTRLPRSMAEAESSDE